MAASDFAHQPLSNAALAGKFSVSELSQFLIIQRRLDGLALAFIAAAQSVTRIRADGKQNGIAQTSRRNEALEKLRHATPAFSAATRSASYLATSVMACCSRLKPALSDVS